MLTRILAACAVVALACGSARSDDAKDRLTAFLTEIKGADAGRISELTDGAATFPDHTLFAFVFPQFPVAREAPAPFKAGNVIAIPKKKDAKPVVMTISQDVENFFKASARPVKTEAEAQEAVKFWARAHAELNQDGFYMFTVKAEPAKILEEGINVTAAAVADQKNGDSGEVKATITFKDGKLGDVTTKKNLKAGMRPRCQATKLLDPDPIVRGMAEDAIRFMGRSARPYLDEQRAKASAELREAIDRAWRKIEEEGR
jgi:hypothetical protein